MIRALLASIALISAPVRADTLIDNVNGLTLTREGKVLRFNGLLIGSDGKVKQLLVGKDKRPARPDYRVDGRGRVLMPGLIDAHGHVMGVAWQAVTLDLSDTKSLAEAQAKIKSYAEANPGRRWIIGRGWNQESWGLGRFPTAAELDAAIADRPVWLERVDGHAGWANTAAMNAAGIPSKSVSPTGGRIELSNGKPSGIFVDAAMELIQQAVPQPLTRERDAAFLKGQALLLRYGITGMADMGTTVEDWMTFRRAGDKGQLSMRIFSYSAGIAPMLSIAGGEPTPWLYFGKLRMAGVKLYADGALGSRGAWLKAPYADKPGERGLQFSDSTKLNNLMSRAAMDGFQVAAHGIGDAAVSQILDGFEEIGQTFNGDRRWRLEHAQVINKADLPRFAKLGVIASMQPVHQTSDRLMAEARLGPERVKLAYSWNSLKQSGAHLAFGSDTPVENPNPFVGLAVAISREDEKGEPFGGWFPEERVSREVALAGFTTEAAYASFAETRLGTLLPGYYADFLLVDVDPLFSSPSALRKTVVDETWVGGFRVFAREGVVSK